MAHTTQVAGEGLHSYRQRPLGQQPRDKAHHPQLPCPPLAPPLHLALAPEPGQQLSVKAVQKCACDANVAGVRPHVEVVHHRQLTQAQLEGAARVKGAAAQLGMYVCR